VGVSDEVGLVFGSRTEDRAVLDDSSVCKRSMLVGTKGLLYFRMDR
jgi:hypothetical protein